MIIDVSTVQRAAHIRAENDYLDTTKCYNWTFSEEKNW